MLNDKFEAEVKIRREMEELKYDLEFKLENEIESSNNYKVSHEKLQISCTKKGSNGQEYHE